MLVAVHVLENPVIHNPPAFLFGQLKGPPDEGAEGKRGDVIEDPTVEGDAVVGRSTGISVEAAVLLLLEEEVGDVSLGNNVGGGHAGAHSIISDVMKILGAGAVVTFESPESVAGVNDGVITREGRVGGWRINNSS